MEEFRVEIESIGQAVCRIDAQHQGPIVKLRQFHARGGGQAGLAHTAFSAEQQDPHVCILEHWQRRVCGERITTHVVTLAQSSYSSSGTVQYRFVEL